MSDEPVRLRVDRSRCVLCGEPNECVLARAESDRDERCWCVDVEFASDLRERATLRDGGASCICRRCAERGR